MIIPLPGFKKMINGKQMELTCFFEQAIRNIDQLLQYNNITPGLNQLV